MISLRVISCSHLESLKIMRHAMVIEHAAPDLVRVRPGSSWMRYHRPKGGGNRSQYSGRLSSTLKLPNEAKKALRLLNLYFATTRNLSILNGWLIKPKTQ